MSETAPDRLARMLAMVGYLRDHPAVPVTEVAQHFGISEKQVLDDVNTLWVSGTPGYMHGDLIDFSSDDLEHGVLTLLDSREMDRPLRLSSEEAVALLVGLQSLGAALGEEEAALVEETAAALRAAAGEAASTADVVHLRGRGRVDARVGQLRDALARGRRVHLRYVSASDQTTERDVDPLQLLTDSDRWFLMGWCHRAQDVRQFRLDRILDLTVLETPADAHPDVELTGRTEPDTASATQVRMQIATRARWFAEQLPGARIRELEEGWFELTVGVVDEAWFGNLVLALGDDVRDVAPPSIAEPLRQRAAAALQAYDALAPPDPSPAPGA